MGFKFQKDIWRLLRQNISKGQLLGYSLANLVGLSVIMIGIMFFLDSRHSNDAEDKYFSQDYVVLSKRVEGIGFTPTSFSDAEIERLEQQAWVKKVGRFTSSRFAVNGSVNMGGKRLSTYLFFESVPDDFFDVKPQSWYFEPEENFVPVILSKDYLTLYNFGFAIPQGLPQISEEIVGAVPIQLTLTGENQQPETFSASIVGFSSRLNTIAVPQDFMDWANKRYSTDSLPDPSRLIVEIDRLTATDMQGYLQEAEIEVSGNASDAGNISHFLSVVSSVVTTNGVVISLLALFILLLAIFLLLQKNKEKLRNLMLLGYAPREVGRYYELFVFATNSVITLLSLLVSIGARLLWIDELKEIGLGGASVGFVVVAAVSYLLIITMVNIIVIRRKMMDIWHDR